MTKMRNVHTLLREHVSWFNLYGGEFGNICQN